METISEKTFTNTSDKLFSSSTKKNIIKYTLYSIGVLALFSYVYYTAKSCVESIVFDPIKEHHWMFDEMKEAYVNDVHLWYSLKNENHPIVLFCHGNQGNISHRKYVIDMTKEFDCSVVLFDYYGYGKSKGCSNTEKILKNGEDVYQWMLNTLKVSESQIAVMGESLGGSVATHIAHKYHPGKLILLSTFSCLTDIAKLSSNLSYSWKLASSVFIFLIGNLQISEKLNRVNCPVLIIHSKEDSFIPYSNAIKNFETIPHNQKQFLEIKGDHCSPRVTLEDLHKIADFLGIKKNFDKEFPKKFAQTVDEIIDHIRKIKGL